jgi:hypothetical protein
VHGRLRAGLTALTVGLALLTVLPARAHAAATRAPFKRICAVSTRPHTASCFALMRTDLAASGRVSLGVPAGYGPSDLQSAYGLPSSTAGGGATVAVVDAFDNPNAEGDLAAYRQQFGLPPCTSATGCFRKVNQNGQAGPLPVGDTGWGAEISLDLDMVSAVCPNCRILLVEAGNALTFNLFPGVDVAINLGAGYVSNSYGGAEAYLHRLFDSLYFDHIGVAITASSGDGGHGVIYPACSSFVTATGGISLYRSSAARGWLETACTEAGSAARSGRTGPAGRACSKRAVADLSAVSDPVTGLAVYDTFGFPGWQVFGGTSAASPIVASIYALAGAPKPGDHPASYPYAHPSNLFDGGSNGTCGTRLCNARPGWNGPTGLGSPDGVGAFAP